MRRPLVALLLIITLFSQFTQLSFAKTPIDPDPEFQPTSDPQYVVINFADTFYFADWGAPEEEWQTEVKPTLKAELEEMRSRIGTGSAERRLAWSTLLEYTDMPMDTPSSDSRYAIQARRIMELAEELDFPVFMPLDGFQWWNEVPELWNHWDHDGNQTPGCTNAEYDKVERYVGEEPVYRCKFPKLRDPEYRQRFIDGYDPENKWNVEWQDWDTPMRLNWRNWGAGGFQLAPPPNLAAHERLPLSYRQFQQQRFEMITQEIETVIDRWENEQKQHLFAGLTIGTEVSLNASVTKEDEFEPYGYRGIQDVHCPQAEPTCGTDKQGSGEWTQTDITAARAQVVQDYLANLSKIAVKNGIPKQRVYTHVWSETRPGDARYMNYLEPSFNLYARPTLSLYGDAQDPLKLPLLKKGLSDHGQPRWGGAEFSTDKEANAWHNALANTMDNSINSAIVIDVYNWKEHKDTPAEAELKRFMQQRPRTKHLVSEVVPLSEPVQFGVGSLNWEALGSDQATKQELLLFKRVRPQFISDEPTQQVELDTQDTFWNVVNLEPGVYFWYIKRSTADGTVYTTSEPRVFTVELEVEEPGKLWGLISL